MDSKHEAPVLLIIFNRPDTTQVVFDAIRKAKPAKLYVSADAPRLGNENDKTNCEKAREIVKKVDWECNVNYRFLDENLGCGWGPASAISWAFENEDRLIILEDDCVPAMPFFPYCNYLLEKYLTDTRIWNISGRSHEPDSKYFLESDYVFSHYGHSWGWATWKRCWEHFDMEMKSFPDFIKDGGAKNVFFSEREGQRYNEVYNTHFNDKTFQTHVWDFQFGYSILVNGELSIVPAKNLIRNIGFFGTHTSKPNKFTALEANEDYRILREPKFVLANRDFDRYHFNNHIIKILGGPQYKRILRNWFKKIGLKK